MIENTVLQTSVNDIEEDQVSNRATSLITAESLGSKAFKKDYKIRYAYMTGSMYRGIASPELVIKMAKAGMLSFLGTGGMSLPEITQAINIIKKSLDKDLSFGVNILFQPSEPWIEEEQVDLFLKENIRCAEASAYMQGLSLALIRYRLSGAKRNNDGSIVLKNKIIAKVSRPEVASVFMSPPPQELVQKLVEQNKITAIEAEIAEFVPVADDICVEADSGGHTDQGVAFVLLPAMIKLRNELVKNYQYKRNIRIGAAGGLGLPESVAAAFLMGADFIATGSINQCTVESGNSDQAKDMLQEMNIQDTEYAPAGDMFEIGAKVQVLKKGLFFPARANKLYEIYKQYESLDDIDAKIRQQIETRFMQKTFEDVYKDTEAYFLDRNPNVIKLAESNPKYKMGLVFKWYFVRANHLALSGSIEDKVDYQIQTGPALGAFNQLVKKTNLENWRNRHVDEIAFMLLNGAANILNEKYSLMVSERESSCINTD